MHYQIPFLFGLLWTVWALELGFFAALLPYVP
jgi:hypothetical protein